MALKLTANSGQVNEVDINSKIQLNVLLFDFFINFITKYQRYFFKLGVSQKKEFTK